jgi:MFS family permease
MPRRWTSILFLWLLGVLAAAQLAKISVIAPVLRSRFGLTLTETGWLISLLEVGGGLFGFVAGLGLGRVGCRRALLSGLVLLAVSGLWEASASSAIPLFAARAMEGLAYLLVVIAAPTTIATIADAHARPRALALWSTFVPVGVAIGSAVTSLALAPWGLRGVMLGWAMLVMAAIPIAIRLPIGHGIENRIAFPPAPAWLATIAFGLYTLSICALTMLLPTYLVEQRGAAISTSGLIAALASGATLPAFGFALWAMRGGAPGRRTMILIATPALVGAGALGAAAFTGGTGLAGASMLAVLAIGVGGIVSPLMFARLPVLAGVRRGDDPRIASANGLLTQFGAGGALLGPPLAARLVEHAGWQALGIAFALLSLAMLATLIAAEQLSLRTAA